MTFGIVVIAAGLYASTIALATFAPTTLPRFAQPGAMTVLQITAFPEIHGPFELWNGHVWKLFFNAMHHAGLGHLLLNCISLWFLGGLLENRIGKVKYAWIFLTSAYAAMLAQFLVGDFPVGMSGAICAVFGYLIALRKYDDEVEQRLPPGAVKLGIGTLVLFVPLTATGLLPIANLAHFVGLGYGWILGWLAGRFARRARWRAQVAFVALHLGIVGLTFAAMHPVWDGRYQAWLAFNRYSLWEADRTTDRSIELDRWRKASERAPDIAIAWLGEAKILAGNGQTKEAWKTALNGLRLNRDDEELDKFVRLLWNEWRSRPHRADTALAELREVFKEESDAWIRRLELEGPPPTADHIDMVELLSLLQEKPPARPRLDAELDVPRDVVGITSPHPPSLEPGQVNPLARDSALLGETL